ncbi:MAG: AbrB/MazE/SpoVT family DNA-binding domain-containing protein [Candidatus Binatia bacterium]
MRTTIDAAGRVVIPKALRERGSFAPGTELDVRLEDGHLVLEPRALQVAIRKRGAFFVAEALEPVSVLRQRDVERVVGTLRSERGLVASDSSPTTPPGSGRKKPRGSRRTR